MIIYRDAYLKRFCSDELESLAYQNVDDLGTFTTTWRDRLATLQAVHERLTRLEERGAARDERIAAYQTQNSAELKQLEASIAALVAKVDAVANDVRDAKTGLRIGMGIMTTIGALAGWVVSHFWLK